MSGRIILFQLAFLGSLGCGDSVTSGTPDKPTDTGEVIDPNIDTEDTTDTETTVTETDTEETGDTAELPATEDPNFGECDDDIDNDGDGYTDCYDNDCSDAIACLDADGDGHVAADDCNDNDDTIYPGAIEIANDGIDQNCDGADATAGEDADGDGYNSFVDCDDNDPSIHPEADDPEGDGIDQDCDGIDGTPSYVDNDFDGYYDTEDCDDNDFNTYPGAAYNDSWTDCMTDADYDGYGDDNPSNPAVTPGTDCDDNDWQINPGSFDIADDGIDQDCSGADNSTADDDSDGFNVNEDCNDNDPAINPNATDIPNDGIDQDCSGYDASDVDLDGDGFDSNHDCDDNDATINPDALETPNDGIDQDCDGSDLVGSCPLDDTITGSASPAFSSNTSPTNDQATLSCNFSTTPEYMLEWTADQRGCASIDTIGTMEDTVLAIFDQCPGYGGTELDCNDEFYGGYYYSSFSYYGESLIQIDVTQNTNYFIAVEGYFGTLSNAIVNISIDTTQDCAGNPLDQDGDGYDPDNDCNDNDPSINPGATEIPADGIDQNCDNIEYCYVDLDGDTYGSSEDSDGDGEIDTIPSVDLTCDGFLEADNTDDCDDLNATINPNATDTPNDGIDQDCNGVDAN